MSTDQLTGLIRNREDPQGTRNTGEPRITRPDLKNLVPPQSIGQRQGYLGFFKNVFYLFSFDCAGSSVLRADFLRLRRTGAALGCGCGLLLALVSLVAAPAVGCSPQAPERWLSGC